MKQIDQILAIYRQLPKLVCKGLCQHSCGPIDLPKVERDRITAERGRPIGFREDRSCTALDKETGLCTIHPIRPLICRLWGMVDHPLMKCPHGCIPERWITNEQAHAWFRKLIRMRPDDPNHAGDHIAAIAATLPPDDSMEATVERIKEDPRDKQRAMDTLLDRMRDRL